MAVFILFEIILNKKNLAYKRFHALKLSVNARFTQMMTMILYSAFICNYLIFNVLSVVKNARNYCRANVLKTLILYNILKKQINRRLFIRKILANFVFEK